MSFLSPLFLLGALAAAVPVILHFLHRDPEPRVKFPAVRLLRHAPVEDARHRRIREWLLLALRVAALLLMAFAFARPFFSSAAARSAHVTIVALDTSMSMSAPGRFARAQELANNAVARAGAGDLVGVVAFSDAAQIVLAPTADHALAVAAILRARPGFGGTRYGAALASASQAIQSVEGSTGTIVVVTDLQADGWAAGDSAPIPEHASVQVEDAGDAAENLAVTALRITGSHALATIRQSGNAPANAHVRLVVEGRTVSETTVPVAEGAAADVELDGVRGDAVAVSVDDEHGMAGDNTRFALAGTGSRPAIAVVTTNGDPGREAFYVQQALAAGGRDARFSVEGWSTARLSTLRERSVLAPVFLLSTRGLDERGRSALSSFLRGGGGLFVAFGPDVDADVVAQVAGFAIPSAAGAASSTAPRAFVPVDVRHPVFQGFGAQAAALGLARFTAVSPVPQKDCTVVASFTSGEAAFADCAIGSGRALMFGSDLDDRGNDLPLHPSFVPFVQESAAYLAGGVARRGEILVADVPNGVPPAPGIVSVPATDGHPSRRMAVNVDPAESDLSRLTPAEFGATVSQLRGSPRAVAPLAAAEREQQPLWQYALLLAIGCLVAESLVAARAA